MNIDDTILRTVKETKIHIFKKTGIDISEEEIVDIVDSQFRGAVFGFKKGVSIILPLIGRFLFNNRSDTLRRTIELNKLKDQYSEIEFNQLELEAKLKTINRNKERWLKEREKELTIIDLVSKPNIAGGHIIYDKLHEIVDKDE